jgi:hypothetical protein
MIADTDAWIKYGTSRAVKVGHKEASMTIGPTPEIKINVISVMYSITRVESPFC